MKYQAGSYQRRPNPLSLLDSSSGEKNMTRENRGIETEIGTGESDSDKAMFLGDTGLARKRNVLRRATVLDRIRIKLHKRENISRL
jgi:hypothetical protein